MGGFVDGAARTLILILSAVATLAIIGSIAAIPTGMIAQQFGTQPGPTPTAEIEASPSTPSARDEANVTNAAGEVGIVAASAAEPKPTPVERWLEVIAYSLIAIAGLLAVIALTLMRTAHYARLGQRL